MKKTIKLIILLIIIMLQIYLVSVQPINVRVANKYDDQLMIEQAASILEGKWLGEYNCLTLIKGPITPLFIALSNILHIPFLIAQDIFYILACLLLVYELRKLVKNDIVQILTFTILIFNPIIYSSELCRTYRDGIYLALIIYLIAFSMGVFLNRKDKISKLIFRYIGLGITVGAVCLCREEVIWIIPYIVIGIIITIINILIDKEEKYKKKKLLLFLIPLMIVLLMINIVKILNYKYYGIFELNQYWGEEFKEAYGALTRIIPEENIKKVPVTSDMLEKAYKVSPKFAELKEYFEKETFNWAMCGDGISTEIQGGWFHWALMRAVESKGYYKDAKTANEYYQQVADEINEACDNGEIKALKYKRKSNVNRFDCEDIYESIKKMRRCNEISI